MLLATSEAELQELVDHLDQVSRKYSLLINVDKTKVLASDGITLVLSTLMREDRWRKYVHRHRHFQVQRASGLQIVFL